MPPIDPPRPTVFDPTRSRPEPWFIGSGKGLMIAVLTICGALIVARAASMVWMTQAAWEWWRQRQTSAPGYATPPAPPPLPPRAVPPPDPALANARLKGNPGAAFGPDSYPVEALRADEQGRVVAQLIIDASGTPRKCDLITRSGSRHLDSATCRIALARVRFDPARDAQGVAIGSTYRLPVRWVLPDMN